MELESKDDAMLVNLRRRFAGKAEMTAMPVKAKTGLKRDERSAYGKGCKICNGLWNIRKLIHGTLRSRLKQLLNGLRPLGRDSRFGAKDPSYIF